MLKQPRYCQRGVSMISLMIGLLVSMIGILAVTSMHKSLIRVSIDSTSDSQLDNNIALALLQIEMDLQSAGFGMASADATTVVNDGDQALYWRYNDGAIVCKSLKEESYTDTNGLMGRQLVTMTATSGCDDVIDLTDTATITWHREVTAQFRNQQAQLFSFDVKTADCTPYGFGVPKAHRQVIIEAPSSARVFTKQLSDAGASVTVVPFVTYQYCLANTYP